MRSKRETTQLLSVASNTMSLPNNWTYDRSRRRYLFLLALVLAFTALFSTAAISGEPNFINGMRAFNSKDYVNAAKEFIPLTEPPENHHLAANYLGLMYYVGIGVPKNHKKALILLEQSTDIIKDQRSHHILGVIYEKGEVVPRNVKTAIKWFKLAAERKYQLAQLDLGAMYEDRGKPLQDLIQGHMWYAFAASNTSTYSSPQRIEAARVKLDNIEKKMSPSQIEKAISLRKECIKKDYKGC